MNRITKICVLWLALCGLLVSLYASAVGNPEPRSQRLSLQLNWWESSCVMDDYNLGSHNVSALSQETQHDTHPVYCTFLDISSRDIQFDLGDLSNWTETILNDYFTWNITNISVTGSLDTTSAGEVFSFSDSQQVYTKQARKIWIWTWNLEIRWTIPGWKPEWTYTWVLNLSLIAHWR